MRVYLYRVGGWRSHRTEADAEDVWSLHQCMWLFMFPGIRKGTAADPQPWQPGLVEEISVELQAVCDPHPQRRSSAELWWFWRETKLSLTKGRVWATSPVKLPGLSEVSLKDSKLKWSKRPNLLALKQLKARNVGNSESKFSLPLQVLWFSVCLQTAWGETGWPQICLVQFVFLDN